MRRLVMGFAALVVSITFSGISSGGMLPTAGVIHSATRIEGDKICGIYLQILGWGGRMPAASKDVNVLNGNGTVFYNSCYADGVDLVGSTPAGTMEWTCDGVVTVVSDGGELPLEPIDVDLDSVREPFGELPPQAERKLDQLTPSAHSVDYRGRLRLNAVCVTVGFPGSFRLVAEFVLGEQRYEPFRTYTSARGFYRVVSRTP